MAIYTHTENEIISVVKKIDSTKAVLHDYVFQHFRWQKAEDKK